jgi:hypothetical protein
VAFFSRYWKGEIALAKAVWLVVLPSAALLFALAEFNAYAISIYDLQPKAIFALYELSWLLAAFASIWLAFGLWRAATKHRQMPGRPAIWGWLAQGMTALGLALLAAGFAAAGLPQTRDFYRAAVLGDPDIPDFALRLEERNTELRIDGGVKFGLAAAVEQMLDANPSVATISLSSLGGRISEAAKLYALIKRRHLNTVVNDQCLSACAYVFAGGAQRWLGVNGQLGFHGGGYAGLREFQIAESERAIVARIEADDLAPASFLQKATDAQAKDVWRPSRDELLASRYLTSRRPGAASSLRELSAMVGLTAARLRKDLPQTLGPRLILTEIVPEQTTLVYIYDVLPPDDTKYFEQNTQYDIYSQFKSDACSNDSTKSAIDIGIFYQFRFRATANGSILYQATINDCS